jgi:hypothetical protein
VLDRTFPFERLADAHAYMLSDAQVGKIVITMGDGASRSNHEGRVDHA